MIVAGHEADVGFFRMEQIIQELLHLADIEAVPGLDGTVQDR